MCHQSRPVLLCLLAVCPALLVAQDKSKQDLDREFKSAVAQYDAGRFAAASAQLEGLLPLAPDSFDVQELLGLTYAAQSLDEKALEHLEVAVRLKPNSAPARTNLAVNLSHAGKTGLAEEEFREALALEPHDYEANHDLGELYAQSGKISNARPLFEEAERIRPASYENGYDLAQADLLAGKLTESRQLAEKLIQQKNTGELHNLLAQIDEKDKRFVAAANEYGAAAHLDPSERNIFDWGSELLLHRTYDPAIDVFRQGAARYPASPRMLIGLGISLYWRGRYDESIKDLLAAADLNPSDPRCYFFLSKAYDNSPSQAEAVIQRFRQYAQLEPNNALAQYYYAMGLWKGRSSGETGLDIHAVELLLQKSIALDESSAEAHFQLGNLYTDQHDYSRSIPQYERALQLDPNFADAHYRLGQYYVHIGRKEHAKEEFDVYQTLRAHRQAELDKQAAAVQQFVFSTSATHADKP